MNNSITAAEVLGEGKVILVPVNVPMPSGRVVALLTTVAALGVLGAALAYSAGKTDGEIDARWKLREEFETRKKSVEEKADARVEEIRRERGQAGSRHEART